MALDVELYRRTVYVPLGKGAKRSQRRLSVIDIQPEGATRTIVFVHGYGGSALQWLYQLRFFGQTMRVVAPDLRGHGHSDDPLSLPMSMEGLVDDLDTVLDALQVQSPFVLIAHSFGGAVATEYALRHPERVSELVLIGVPSRFIIRPGLRQLMQIPDPLFSGIAKRIRVALFASQRTLTRMHDHVMAPWRGDERMQLLRVPTLVVLGQRDTVFTRQRYEDVPRIIPGAHNVVIPVSAHLVQLERPDAVNRAIRRFITPKPQQKDAISFLSNVHPGDHTHEASPGMIEARQTLVAHLADMPWLQYYDRDVPEQLPLPEQLLHEMLSNAAQDFSRRTALHFFGQQISYRELDLLSNRFAHALRKLGVNKGDRVAVVLPNIPQCVIAFYGTLKAGGVLVLGSPLSNEEEIAYQVRDSGAHVLLTLISYRDKIDRICTGTEITQVVYTDVREYLPIPQRVLLASLIEGSAPHGQASLSLENSNGAAPNGTLPAPTIAAGSSSWRCHSFQHLLRNQPTTLLESGTTADDLALLQYTSGTTDNPKGVMLTHGNLMVNISQVRHWMPDARRGREVVLSVLPLSHAYGVTDCLNLPVALAASIVLLPTARIDEILKAIKRYHPSIFPGIPSLYLAIANYPHVRSYGVGSIRTCVSGSAPLPIEVQEAFEKLTRGRLVEGYGLTEASPVTHANPLQGERRVGSIGIPLPGTNARVVDWKTGTPLPPGEVGELLIRGPQVMQGYWNMAAETAQALKDGWLHTGDLAVMDEDGFFSIIERKKDIILSGPYNVYPRDVEEVLYEHPKVLEAAVVSTPLHGGNGSDAAISSVTTQSPFIKAVVVLKRGEKASADELLALCRERLDSYKVPKQIEFRSELPKNAVGKVLRRLLVET